MSETFEYTYSSAQQKEIELIRNKYLPKEENKMETLRKLDKKADNLGCVAALVFGILGTLLFGFGMCCTLVWSENLFIIGIIIGIIGMVVFSMAYPIYKKVTAKERAKLAEQILALSNELLMS